MAIKEYRLGDIVKPQSLKRVYEKDWATNGIPFLKVEDILKIGNSTFKPKTFIPEWLFINLKEKYKFPAKGSVLLTTGGSVGNTWIYDGRNCWFKDSAIRYFECDENKMLNKYLYLWFIKNKDLINHSVSGSVMKIITSETINNWKIILPDLQTQQEIINIIEPFEKLIEQINKKINNVDLIFQNIIENIKTKSKIVDLASINAGQSPPQISKYWKNGKIPFVNINDLTNNMYVLFSKNFINDLAYKDYKCKLTTNFSILVGKVSPSKNKISVIDNGFIVNGAIRILEPLDKNAYGQLFESIRNKAYILSKIACGSVQQQINSLQLSNLEINFDLSMNEIFNIQLNYKKVLLKSLNVIQKIISSLIELNII